ncbi:hypothetical protein J6590_007785 [Homalodisca vitripennis]|nr:hypothetical protein J6590_007785 [Homalodisca vitripennis]
MECFNIPEAASWDKLTCCVQDIRRQGSGSDEAYLLSGSLISAIHHPNTQDFVSQPQPTYRSNRRSTLQSVSRTLSLNL